MIQPIDRKQIAQRGISVEELERQLDLFHRPPSGPDVTRPCRLSDGILRLRPDTEERLLNRWRQAANRADLLRFVPASGAATRMFQSLQELLQREVAPIDEVRSRAKQGDPQATDLLRFLEQSDRLPFFDRLRAALDQDDLDADRLRMEGDHQTLLTRLLDPKHLGYGSLPKGLIEFHRYPSGARTALEEHLHEAALHLTGVGGRCNIHFTVSPEHREAFATVLSETAPRTEESCELRFRIGLSVQEASTDTLAVDPELRPFRLEDGRLLFRPGGHGSLLKNLNALEAEVLVLKNIDNIAPSRIHQQTARWKQILVGYLLELRDEIFLLQERLEKDHESRVAGEGLRFLAERLALRPPDLLSQASSEAKREYLLDRLDRPLRVCGLVRNEGEPGGGPFWVRDRDGGESGQIVEASHIRALGDRADDLLLESTHFNPVDIAAALTDRHGHCYDLQRFVDRRAVFISSKSHQGRPLLALERPGLWNGAMAGWNTAFVEVPAATFTPVKTVFDLLRPEHQP